MAGAPGGPDPYNRTMLVDGNGKQIKTSDNGDGTATLVSTSPPVLPAAANVLNGVVSATASGGPTTLLTIPAGRVWQGSIGLTCSVQNAAGNATAGQARGVIATAGTGVAPTAGTVMAAEAKCGANAATGTVGSQGTGGNHGPLVVVAPPGNAVTLTVSSTIAGTAGVVDAWASGLLL